MYLLEHRLLARRPREGPDPRGMGEALMASNSLERQREKNGAYYPAHEE